MRAWVVCLLALAAGCSGFASGPPSPTLTPAPVPGDATADYPPGTEPAGVAAPLELAEAHYDALYRRSQTLRRVRTERHPNGTLYRRRGFEGQFSGNLSRFAVSLSTAGPGAGLVPGPPTRERLWTDGDVLAQSITVGNETTQRLLPAGAFSRRPGPFDRGPGSAFGLPGPDREILLLFRAIDVDVSRVGERTFVARGEDLVRPSALAEADGVTDPRNASLEATVTSDGLVRRYRVAYDASVDGQRVDVVRTVAYARVGETDVDRPAWAAALLAERARTESV